MCRSYWYDSGVTDIMAAHRNGPSAASVMKMATSACQAGSRQERQDTGRRAGIGSAAITSAPMPAEPWQPRRPAVRPRQSALHPLPGALDEPDVDRGGNQQDHRQHDRE